MNQTTEMASNPTQTGSSTIPVTTETNDRTRAVPITDVTIHWDHQNEIARMMRLGKTVARVVPEPTNPWDKNAHKVVIEDDGILYKMGCLRKGVSNTFPPGEYVCYFDNVISGMGRRLYQCVLTKRDPPKPAQFKKRKLKLGA